MVNAPILRNIFLSFSNVTNPAFLVVNRPIFIHLSKAMLFSILIKLITSSSGLASFPFVHSYRMTNDSADCFQDNLV